MTASGNMPPPDPHHSGDSPQWALPVSQKVVLVIDLVESVRLMAADEAGTVARWHSFAHTAQHQTIPQHHGRLVKSLGDGLMVEFESPRDATNAAQAMHAAIAKTNPNLPTEQHMHLRAGINATHVYTDSNDIFGAGVNLAARIATLAGPGETVVTAPVRDALTDGLDATIEDLGECYLKHIDEPVRAYRVGDAGQAPVVVAQKEYVTPLRPTIAVIPFVSSSNEPEHFAIGELIADGVISQLSRSAYIRVISRFSTAAFRNRQLNVAAVENHLGAGYVLSGIFAHHGQSLLISAELTHVSTSSVVWSLRKTARYSDLFDPGCELVADIALESHRRLVSFEIQHALNAPLPTLDSCTLLLGAISQMHRMSRSDFQTAGKMLEHLIARHPKYVEPKAWLAKWYSLAVAQGWSPNPARYTTHALGTVQQALDIDSEHSLALSVKALIHGYVEKRFDIAKETYELALKSNPNEPLAWIGTATLQTWQGKATAAVESAETALSLSPIDPMKYYFDSLASTAMLAAGRYERAIELATRSLKANRLFSSTYKILLPAQYLSGNTEAAKQSALRLMQVDPVFSVNAFRKNSPLFQSTHGEIYAKAFEHAGIPVS